MWTFIILLYYIEVVNMVAYTIYRELKRGDRVSGAPEVDSSGLSRT